MKTFSIFTAFALSLLLTIPGAAQTMATAEQPALAGFGTAVAVGNGQVFIGEGSNELRPGMVYVYAPDDDGGWTEAAQLTAPDAAVGDGFGRSLAAVGGVLLVGQQNRSESTVHVFVDRGDEWEYDGELLPESLPDDAAYGASLAVDPFVAAVGAVGVGQGAGRVYLFERTAGDWSPAGYVEADGAMAGDGFGAAIDVDGIRMLVGAPGRANGAGAAMVFRQDPGTSEWSQEAVLEGEELAPRNAFGAAVLLDRNLALVSAPRHADNRGTVFQFELDAVAEEWGEASQIVPFDAGDSGRFGQALALGPAGVFVGAPAAGQSGAIYVLRAGADGWSGMDRIVSERVAPGGNFGATLAVGENVAVAGATGEDFGAGSAVILSRSGMEYRPAVKVASEAEALPAVTGSVARCQGGEAAALFGCADVDLLSFLPISQVGGDRGVGLNDIWGWVDPATGREYALVGRINGTSFVDVTEPTNPRYLGDLPMTPGARANAWRDIKVYDDHAFIVADGAGQHGMQVFDLTRLRDVTEPATFDVDALYERVASVHNIVIDTTSGFAFAVGSGGGGETCGGGLHMIDVRNPQSPEFAGCFADPQTGRASTGYTHDAQCVTYDGPDADYQGREICMGANETALSIADVTDKDAPIAVARATYPNVGYAHQGWFSEDKRYFYLGDELDELQGLVSQTRTLIWDVVDLDDPVLAGEYMGTTESSDHNLYIVGDRVYQSNYQAGLQILDISDPENPRQVAHFDTAPYTADVPGFGGTWSNYPFFPSGNVIMTSGSEGLFVLRPRDQ